MAVTDLTRPPVDSGVFDPTTNNIDGPPNVFANPGASKTPGGRNNLPFFDWQFGDDPYSPNPQPQTTARGGRPAYYVPPNQLNPLQIRPILGNKDYGTNRKEIYKQLIPTSVNVRNAGLENLLQQMNTPMEQLYAAQGMSAVANQRNNQLDQLRAGLTQRGVFNSGIMDEAELSTDMGYLRGAAGVQNDARAMEDQRQNQLLQQLLSVPEADLRFYSAIRGGTIPAGSLWSSNPQAYGMLAHGAGTLIRSVASMGAGAAAGGAAGGAMGSGGMMGGAGGAGGGAGGMMSMFGGGMGGGGTWSNAMQGMQMGKNFGSNEQYNPYLY